MGKEFISSLSRDNIKILKTAYKNLIKNFEIVKKNNGTFLGDHIEYILGIDKADVDFLVESKLLCKYKNVDNIGYTHTEWYLTSFLEKLVELNPLFEKEDGRFELRFKLYKIFSKKNFEDAFNWVFESDKSEWDNKLQCIKYNCGIFGNDSTNNTLEEAKKLYNFLNE